MIAKPSKSALKREYQALQVLGEQLIDLTAEQLRRIDLPESLLDAVLAAKAITAHGAMRRQKQLIGKIMRAADAEPIKAALEALGSSDRKSKQVFHQAEEWRERLTGDDRDDLDEYFLLVGHRNEILAELVANWFSAPGDDARRLVRRKIFREIHKDLTSKMQSTALSI